MRLSGPAPWAWLGLVGPGRGPGTEERRRGERELVLTVFNGSFHRTPVEKRDSLHGYVEIRVIAAFPSSVLHAMVIYIYGNLARPTSGEPKAYKNNVIQ